MAQNGYRSLTLRIGWILLLILGLLLIAGGVASVVTAYGAGEDLIAGVRLEELAKVHPDLPNAIRGRRATAAFYAFSCGMLVCWIALTAYRRREKWAWRALLTSLGLGCILSLLRVPILGTRPGADVAGLILAVVIVALAISYRDFK